MARAAVGVHLRKPYAKFTAFSVRRQEQDLLPVRRPDGVGRSAAAVVVGEVGELRAVGVDRENLATGPFPGIGLEDDLGAVW